VLQPVQIVPHLLKQLCDGHLMVRRKILCELFAPLGELAHRSFDVAGLQMVERGSYLDETLNKRPVTVAIFVPEIFKDFVCFEEGFFIEFFQPAIKPLIHHTKKITNRAYKFKTKSFRFLVRMYPDDYR